jgi:hypothetical protein
MSALAAVSLLVFYPLLMNLPLNLVRFQWGFKRGLAPMSPDVQKQAEAADRMVLYVSYFILLAVVVALLNRSQFSVYAVGLTIGNWKSAIALGALSSLLFVSLESIIPAEKLREEAESQGSLASWCGLTVLGSLSVELWRAFCIVSLIRLDLSSWVAVLVVATAYGASQLSTTIATAAGASTVAAAAGFLFVKTGSLLAPLAMSLIAAGVHFYRVRHISIGQSRYVTKCGVCSATFHPSEIEAPFFTPNFPCPKCGEQLEYEYPVRHVLANAVFSGLVALGLPFVLGLRGVTYALSAVVALPVVSLLATFIFGVIDPTPREARRNSHQKFVPDGKLSLNSFKPTDKRKP